MQKATPVDSKKEMKNSMARGRLRHSVPRNQRSSHSIVFDSSKYNVARSTTQQKDEIMTTQQPAAEITLEIQLVSKPEMSVAEATQIISDDFPRDEKPIISRDTKTGIVTLKLKQAKLTDEQRDWLHLSHFAARYVDSYKVK